LFCSEDSVRQFVDAILDGDDEVGLPFDERFDDADHDRRARVARGVAALDAGEEIGERFMIGVAHSDQRVAGEHEGER
jgi:hypothetical protein